MFRKIAVRECLVERGRKGGRGEEERWWHLRILMPLSLSPSRHSFQSYVEHAWRSSSQNPGRLSPRKITPANDILCLSLEYIKIIHIASSSLFSCMFINQPLEGSLEGRKRSPMLGRQPPPTVSLPSPSLLVPRFLFSQRFSDVFYYSLRSGIFSPLTRFFF